MNFLRHHWYDLGGLLAVALVAFLIVDHQHLSDYELVMWLSLLSLFLHQLEEYRIAGTFPGMVNRVLFHSDLPDRFPLNTNTAFLINVVIGWGSYFLAALLAERAVWLGIATILISLGNIIAHTFLFNIKGKTRYNAGLITSWICLAPCVVFFFEIVHRNHLATAMDYFIGIPLGVLLNVVGVLKMIQWLADRNTPFIFAKRNLLPTDRLQ